MNGEGTTYRVTVRGRFGELTERARRYLMSAVAEHDIFVSAFTEEGTFTYDERLAFFNLRYEFTVAGEDRMSAAERRAFTEAEDFLRTMGFTHRGLRVSIADMSAMWSDADRRAR